MQKYRTLITSSVTVASENLIEEKYETFRWQCGFFAADTDLPTLLVATARRYTVLLEAVCSQDSVTNRRSISTEDRP